MNVTYLIGNGFDLSLKLKTSYKDFLENSYLSKPSSDRIISKFKENIHRELNTWSAAEEAFGVYTKKYTISKVYDFTKCYNDFIANLNDYFTQIEEEFEIKEDKKLKYFNAFEKALFNLPSFFADDTAQQVSEKINDLSCLSDSNHYLFISFNYTTIFDLCLYCFLDTAKQKYYRKKEHKRFKSIAKEAIHVHGTYSSNMVLGVNDKLQIQNGLLSELPSFQDTLIKSNIINATFPYRTANVKRAITNSDIICLYGLSIGITDNNWWNRIGIWLKKDPNHILLIFMYNIEVNCSNGSDSNTFCKKVKERFFDNASIAPTERSKIRAQVFVCMNKNLFI